MDFFEPTTLSLESTSVIADKPKGITQVPFALIKHQPNIGIVINQKYKNVCTKLATTVLNLLYSSRCPINGKLTNFLIANLRIVINRTKKPIYK